MEECNCIGAGIEIYKDYISCRFCKKIVNDMSITQNTYPTSTNPNEGEQPFKDENIKQGSIKYVHWVMSNQWDYLHWGGNRGSGWHQGRDYKSDPITDEQLYELYQLQSK